MSLVSHKVRQDRIRWNNIATDNTHSNTHTYTCNVATLPAENIHTHTTEYRILYVYICRVCEEGGNVHFTPFHPEVERTHLFTPPLSFPVRTHAHKHTQAATLKDLK